MGLIGCRQMGCVLISMEGGSRVGKRRQGGGRVGMECSKADGIIGICSDATLRTRRREGQGRKGTVRWQETGCPLIMCGIRLDHLPRIVLNVSPGRFSVRVNGCFFSCRVPIVCWFLCDICMSCVWAVLQLVCEGSWGKVPRESTS